jgi:hypothetical protein
MDGIKKRVSKKHNHIAAKNLCKLFDLKFKSIQRQVSGELYIIITLLFIYSQFISC